jgi:hypothetical protein
VALAQQVDALRDVLDELGRREDLRVLAQAEHERRELAGVRVGRGEDDAVVDVAHLAEAAVVALDLPGDALDTQTSAVSSASPNCQPARLAYRAGRSPRAA